MTRRSLLRRSTLITPNLPEAARLADESIPQDLAGIKVLAERLHSMGAPAVLVKGGHLSGPEAIDLLFDGADHRVFRAPRVETANTHGTGCTLSSAIAAYLAQGKTLVQAIEAAKHYLTAALAQSGRLRVGRGHGPVHHLHPLWPSEPAEVR